MDNNKYREMQERSLRSLEREYNKNKRLYDLTNHSKKKQRHLEDMNFYLEVIEDAKEEYGMK